MMRSIQTTGTLFALLALGSLGFAQAKTRLAQEPGKTNEASIVPVHGTMDPSSAASQGGNCATVVALL